MTIHFKPREVLAQIQSDIKGTSISQPLLIILRRMYDSSQKRQIHAGNRFELSFEEYLSLITRARRQRMERELKANTFKQFMMSTTGYVLTWKSRSAKASGVMNVQTAEFVNRERSRRNQHLAKGDTHSEASKAAISQALKGRTHSEDTKAKIKVGNAGQTRSDETRAKISAARTGRSMSAETKAKMAAKRAAYWAAKRSQLDN